MPQPAWTSPDPKWKLPFMGQSEPQLTPYWRANFGYFPGSRNEADTTAAARAAPALRCDIRVF
jgi:hypothetical protein